MQPIEQVITCALLTPYLLRFHCDITSQDAVFRYTDLYLYYTSRLLQRRLGHKSTPPHILPLLCRCEKGKS